MSRAKTASFSAYPSAAPAGRRPSALTGSPRRRKVVYLVRHAQAKHNVVELEAQARVRAAGGGVEEQEAARKATLHDPLFRDASLSGSGKDQVALSAADFRRLLRETHCPPAEVVFVSPLERTLQTAQLLFPGHARMICLEALREKRTGLPCDERKPAELLRGRFPSVDFADVLEQDRESDRGYSFRPDSKEGNEALQARTAFLLPFLLEHPSESIAVVTHKGFLREFFKSEGVAPLLDGEGLSTVFGNAEVRVLLIEWDPGNATPPRIAARSLHTCTACPNVDVIPRYSPPSTPASTASAPGEPDVRVAVGTTSCEPGGQARAVGAAWEEMLAKLGGQAPGLVVTYCSPSLDSATVFKALADRATPSGTVVVGGTSAHGVVIHAGASASIALVGFAGLTKSTHIGFCEGGDTHAHDAHRGFGVQAAAAALRDGPDPDMLLSFLSPGNEEAVLDGIREVAGVVPLFGGSVAGGIWDPSERGFQLFVDAAGRGQVTTSPSAVLLAALHLSDRARVLSSLSHCYAPTGRAGVATHGEGRTLSRIDDRPAAEVLNEWILQGGGTALTAGMCMTETASYALLCGGTYRCMHLKSVGEHGEVVCFANPAPGARISLMTSKPSDLVGAAEAVCRAALQHAEFTVRGAIIDFCAVAALRNFKPLADAISSVLDVPFACFFSFGEQGVLDGSYVHGNLMLGICLFGDEAA